MSANLMASSLLSSHASVNREPLVPPSDARGQGDGFESLLADFDPPNAAASADPSAQTASRAALMTNIEAALSALGMAASSLSGPTGFLSAANVTSAADPAAPSADPAALTASRAALMTNIGAALSALAMGAQGAAGSLPAAEAPTAADSAPPSADPSALTVFRTALMTNIGAALSELGTDAPGPTPSIPAADPPTAADPAAPSADPGAQAASRAALMTNIDSALSALSIGAPGATGPISAANAMTTADPAAPSADPNAFSASRAALMTNIDAALSALGMGAPDAPGPKTPVAAETSATTAARRAPATSHTAPITNFDAPPSPFAMSVSFTQGTTETIAAANAGATEAGAGAKNVASAGPSTTPSLPTADAHAMLQQALVLAMTSNEAAPIETPVEFVAGSPAPATAVVATPGTSENAPVSPATTTWPSGSHATPGVPDVGSWLSAAIAQAGAMPADASAAPTLAGGGSGFPTQPSPGAATGAIAYATQIALSFVPELGFQGLQTKTHLAVQSAPNAAAAGARGSAQGNVAASPLSTALQTVVEQANARGDQSSSPNRGRADPSAAAPQAATGQAPWTAQTNVAGISMPWAAASSLNGKAVDISELGQHLANEAQSLAIPSSETNAKLATAPIKELQLDLHPANLGSVAIKLKMTDGKLSVDVRVTNPSALAAVESQRDTMISKLQMGTQALESFVVHQQVSANPFSAQTSSNPSLTGSSGNTSGHEPSSRDAREQTPRQPRTAPNDDALPARNRLGSGLVV